MVNLSNTLGRGAPACQPGASPLLGTNLYTYGGHASSVNAVAWSPDGQRIASGGCDNTVQIWVAATGEHVFIYHGHRSRRDVSWFDSLVGINGEWMPATAETLAWSPDGQRIASAGWDHMVRVWDAACGSHVFTYEGHCGWVHAVAWSPDGQRIASAGPEGTVQLWDAD